MAGTLTDYRGKPHPDWFPIKGTVIIPGAGLRPDPSGAPPEAEPSEVQAPLQEPPTKRSPHRPFTAVAGSGVWWVAKAVIVLGIFIGVIALVVNGGL